MSIYKNSIFFLYYFKNLRQIQEFWSIIIYSTLKIKKRILYCNIVVNIVTDSIILPQKQVIQNKSNVTNPSVGK